MGGHRKDGQPSPGLLRDIDNAIEKWERRPEPISLPQDVVQSTGTIHEGDRTKVRVRVPMLVAYTMTVECEGEVIAWTKKAVQAEVKTPDGRTLRAWVWGSAVQRM